MDNTLDLQQKSEQLIERFDDVTKDFIKWLSKN